MRPTVSEPEAVCVFCGSSTPPDPAYRDAAGQVGRLLADRGVHLVYGGGAVGLMGVVADACMAAGGEVTGVIPTGLFSREVGHRGITRLIEVGSMHERKARMYDLADGFVVLPGGFGTLDELAEVATWSQLGLHRKPVVLLDVDGFWAPLLALFDRMVSVGLLRSENRALIRIAASPADALAALGDDLVPVAEKWINAPDP